MRNNRPLRVCFVIDRLIRGGTELHVLNLIRWLDRRQVQPFLCLLNGEDELSRSLLPDDCPTITLGVRKLLSVHALRQAWHFRQYLKKNQIEVVQTYFPDSTRFAAPIAKAAAVRAVLGSRRNIGHSLRDSDARIAKFYNRFFIDRIVANCEAAKQSVIEQEDANPENVIVLQNGINLDQFEHISPWTPKPNGQSRKVGMVGNLRHIKGPDLFIRAAKLVLEQHPNTRFEIAGSGDMNTYEQLVSDLRLSNVLLIGPIEDVPAFLRTLDIAVLPSRAEGLSNALLEYMAAGRPIVATCVGGNDEMLQDRINGLIVPPNDETSLAGAILELLERPALAEAIAESASSSSADFSADRTASRYFEIIRAASE